jgi:hypothetical protein
MMFQLIRNLLYGIGFHGKVRSEEENCERREREKIMLKLITARGRC